MTDPSALEWRKARRSANSNNCVEVASLPEGGVAVRDSKQRGAGPILCFTESEWDAFIGGVSDGDFGRPPA